MEDVPFMIMEFTGMILEQELLILKLIQLGHILEMIHSTENS